MTRILPASLALLTWGFAIPVLSKEEDAADHLAAFMLLEDFTASKDRILEDAAYGWSLSSA